MEKYFLLFIFLIIIDNQLSFAQSESLNKGEISLEELLNQKISTASKYEENKSQAPASVIIISSEEINRFCYTTFGEILSKIRGFYTRNDHNYIYFGVRGFDRPSSYSNNILLLIDGHTYNENIYGQPFFASDLGFNTGIIERIEIVQGPGATLYGTGAILAVINVITQKGKTFNELSVSGEAGNSGYFTGDLTFGKEVAENLDFLISGRIGNIDGKNLYFKEYDNPENNNGISAVKDWEKFYGIFSKITYKELKLTNFIYSRKKGTPTGSYMINYNDPGAKYYDSREFSDLVYQHKLSEDKNLMLRLYYDHYSYRGFYPYKQMQFDGDNGNWFGFETQFHWDLKDNNRLVLGTEYKNNNKADYFLNDDTTTLFNKNFPYYIISIYLQDSWQIIENLSLCLGLRYDHYSITGNTVSPKGAIIYNAFSKTAFKLLYGSAYRAPNIYELYYEDFDFSIPNNKLLPEKINSLEAVWEQIIGKNINSTLSVYYYFINDLIDQKSINPDTLFPTQFQNNSNLKAVGLEFDFNSKFDFGLWLYGNFSYQYVNTKDNDNFTNSPKFLIKTGLSQKIRENFDLCADFLYETGRLTIYKTWTSPYTLVNLSVKYSPHINSEKYPMHILNNSQLLLKVKNIFDTKYELPGGNEHIQNAIIQDGRFVVLEIKFKLL